MQMNSAMAIYRDQPLQAEPSSERITQRAEALSKLAPETTLRHREREGGPERIWGPTIDFTGVAFLERGALAARAVGRVAYRDGRAVGTGFLIAPGLFITNHHVIESPADCHNMVLELNYETKLDGNRGVVSRFAFDTTFFLTDDRDDLDYTIVGVGERLNGDALLDSFGYIPLSNAGSKHSLGEAANIIQHPDGRMKEVVLRENVLVSRLSHVLHYVADTQPGSSGSPVFNDQWQAIALHHWGSPWRQQTDPSGNPLPRFVNEGIRISAIVDEARECQGELSPSNGTRLMAALQLASESSALPVSTLPAQDSSAPGIQGTLRPDGTASWTIPLEISVGIPALRSDSNANLPPTIIPSIPPRSMPEAFRRKVDTRYEKRDGYREGFIEGHRIDVPKLIVGREERLAQNLSPATGQSDPFEFRYEHFSAYVDKQRRLPLLLACNIDGADLKAINRSTGNVTDAESLLDMESPEGREKWYEDPRIDPDECGNDDLYLDQQLSPGGNRLNRMFHRGHMVRRLDPCWGIKEDALRAEADTFHFTNCVPQIGAFNSRQNLWLGIENHVLKSAKDMKQRICVFTGPIFGEDDPAYREDSFPGFRVPRAFWKVVVWKTDVLNALAMTAKQNLDDLPEATNELDNPVGLEHFVTTVEWVEQMTGLEFQTQVREADLYEFTDGPEGLGSKEPIPVRDFPDIPTSRPTSKARRKK